MRVERGNIRSKFLCVNLTTKKNIYTRSQFGQISELFILRRKPTSDIVNDSRKSPDNVGSVRNGGLLKGLLAEAEARNLARVHLEILIHVVLPPRERDGDEALVLVVGPLLLGLHRLLLVLGFLRVLLAVLLRHRHEFILYFTQPEPWLVAQRSDTGERSCLAGSSLVGDLLPPDPSLGLAVVGGLFLAALGLEVLLGRLRGDDDPALEVVRGRELRHVLRLGDEQRVTECLLY
jgi:hypothetical protein